MSATHATDLLLNLQILTLLRNGYSTKEICKKMEITEKGFRGHLGDLQEEYIEFLLLDDFEIYPITDEESQELEENYEYHIEDTEWFNSEFEIDDNPTMPAPHEPSHEDILAYIEMVSTETETDGDSLIFDGESYAFTLDDDDDDDDWGFDYPGSDMPCDLDASECGTTCFNCPRGN